MYGCRIEPLCHIDLNTDGINVRDTYSTAGNTIGTANSHFGYTAFDKTENEGYTWYNIGLNRWIANNGSWISENALKN